MADQGLARARAAPATCATSSSRRNDEGGTVIVGPDDTAATAYGRMRAADVSQLPVLEGDRSSASSTRATC